MKKILLIASAVLLAGMLSSCISAKKKDQEQTAYNWDDYSDVTYTYVRQKDKDSRAELLASYERIIESQKDTMTGRVPPGVYADYGYMLVEQGMEAEGVAYLRKEMELYSMSEPFLSKIIQRIESNSLGGAYEEDYYAGE